ncbi:MULTISPECIES: phage major tail tube protein [Burkholderia cepacia complex]|uniref:Phage major tail tube protein,Phage tail tube protein FII n=1 Tax=Burkholderia stabilis TaxID=95485 RepID=A0AAJ5T5Y8_9BURK|nr:MULTISPECIES: phage major tail tube protein [Burkholderia cepacia complex]VBB13938.1 phage major tail tube protein,Phage tail tube protein FII [Burkholderia stabilis]VWB67660.1 phage major tail tube protein [Burkholderia contaminans]
MGMPKKLKHYNVFLNGVSYIGQTAELTLPKLTRKMEEWRGGGMVGPVKFDFGPEAMELEWSLGGIDKNMLEQWGTPSVDGVMLRFAGAYQNDSDAEWTAVEIVVRGRYSEVDMGSAKAGDDTTTKATMPLAYYKLSINGQKVIEIDAQNFIEFVGGKDALTQVRKIIGV